MVLTAATSRGEYPGGTAAAGRIVAGLSAMHLVT
jgi:hypothetical protein